MLCLSIFHAQLSDACDIIWMRDANFTKPSCLFVIHIYMFANKFSTNCLLGQVWRTVTLLFIPLTKLPIERVQNQHTPNNYWSFFSPSYRFKEYKTSILRIVIESSGRQDCNKWLPLNNFFEGNWVQLNVSNSRWNFFTYIEHTILTRKHESPKLGLSMHENLYLSYMLPFLVNCVQCDPIHNQTHSSSAFL